MLFRIGLVVLPFVVGCSGAIQSDGTRGAEGAPIHRAHGETGDFTGDRFADFADHKPSTGEFWIHRNRQDHSFDPPGANWGSGMTHAESGWETIVGDFTGDGYADYADHELLSGRFTIHENRHDGTFSQDAWGGGTAAVGSAWEMLIGDFNGDHYVDYADRNASNGTLFIHLNQQDGTFSTSNWGSATTGLGEVLIADFTGDGYADYADKDNTHGTFWVHENRRNGTFAPAGTNWGIAHPSVGGHWETLVGDFTGDGYADYADHDLAGGGLWVHENLRNGSFAGAGHNWGVGQTTVGGNFEVMGYRIVDPVARNGRDCDYYSANSLGADNSHAKYAGVGGQRMGFRIGSNAAWTDAALAPYDAAVAQSAADQVSILALVNNESVANAGQGTWNAPPNTSDGRNAYVQTFVDVTRVLMSRYGDQIKFWEIWNEPNACTSSDYLSVCESNPQHAGGSYIRADIYAKILAEVYVQNHDLIVAKGLHLVLGGIYAHDVNGSHYIADDYLNEVYNNGVWSWFKSKYGRNYAWDELGFHIYTTLWQGGSVPAGTIGDYLNRLKSLRASHGDGTQVFMTEFGWQTPQVNEQQQADDLETSLSVYESHGEVARTYVFRVSEWQGWGMFRGDWSAKPAVGVYRRHAAGCIR